MNLTPSSLPALRPTPSGPPPQMSDPVRGRVTAAPRTPKTESATARRAGVAVLLLLASGACAAPETADLVLTGGKVVTVDDALPEAEAVAVRGDRIAAVGSADEIAALVGPETEVIELDGRLVVPGFIEGHGHYMALGRARMILDLTAVESWEEIVAMVGAAAENATPGSWIHGRGWHQEKWTSVPAGSVEGVPTHHTLSAVSPDNPVLLGHASGHAAFANLAALEAAGIGPDTPDPAGGTIVRDADRNATGLLRENADGLVARVAAAADEARSEEERRAEFRRQVELAGEEAIRKGVTTFQDAGADFSTIDGFRSLADEGALPVRLYVMVRASTEEMRERLAEYRMVGYGDDFLTVRSIKRQIDGALGSHGAWLLEPYFDMPTTLGLAVEEPDDIEATAALALEHDYQLNTHAIGDRANREVLDIYERTFGSDGSGLRWRIEHAQHLHPDDVGRFASLGVIASMQGVHATSDAPWIPIRLGAERTRSGAYIWRELLNAGVTINNGTDVPVEDISPIASFAASVHRIDRNGEVFFADQRMTRMEALRSYTINNAYAAFEEDLKGSITPGKLADLVVLDRDIMTVPLEEIARTMVDYTIIGGEVRHAR